MIASNRVATPTAIDQHALFASPKRSSLSSPRRDFVLFCIAASTVIFSLGRLLLRGALLKLRLSRWIGFLSILLSYRVAFSSILYIFQLYQLSFKVSPISST